MDRIRQVFSTMNLEEFIIPETASLEDAMEIINANHHGFVLGLNGSGHVVGLATDGDIRRHLLSGNTIKDPLKACLNEEFIWADANTSRESLLKRLDHNIRVIPLLDSNKKLVGIISRDYLPIQMEAPVYARSRAPVRISFGGGGSDLTHFFSEHGGAVINATINLYSHATLRKREDNRVLIWSRDLNKKIDSPDLHSALQQKGDFQLIQAVLRTIHPDFGFDLYIHSDFPMNSGLGGSAVVAAAILGCFNQFRQDQWDNHELAELAFQAERLYMGVSGGWQDQYASVFGGFNFMEFQKDNNLVHPLRIHPQIQLELEESLVICDTGISHNSGAIHDDQRERLSESDVLDLVKENVQLTYRLRDDLLRGRLHKFGRLLNQAWQLKRQFSNKISNPELDSIYDLALSNGAIGGKLMGAGGGGFFIFYVTPFEKYKMMQALESIGLNVRQFRFDHKGLQSWTVRESRNSHLDKLL